jgi:hypothetical protein
MPVQVEVIMDRSVDGSELLQGLDVPEPCHGPFPSSERLMRVFGPIIKPPAALLIGPIANFVHGRPVGP